MSMTKGDAVSVIAGVVGAWVAYALFKPVVAAGWGAVTLVGFATGYVIARCVIAWLASR